MNEKRSKLEQRKVSCTKRIVLWASVIFLTIFVVVTVVILLMFPNRESIPTTGKYHVASVLFTYTDENRIEVYSRGDVYRTVNVEFWYPENTDLRHPLVIFSHGALGIRNSNLSLYRELASHGYIIGSMDHPYQALWSRDVEKKLTFLNLDYLSDLQREDAKTDRDQSFEYYQAWMQIRMDDIHFVLETILEEVGESTSGIYSLVDIDHMGVMGHSLGGSAALGIGRQRDDIDAVIALEAPFLFDIEGVEDGEFVFIDEDYPIPVLNIYSDDSWPHLADWPQYARNATLLSSSNSTAFSVHIDGIGHLALTDLALSNPLLVRLLDRSPMTRDNTEALYIINRISLEFFNYFLKGIGDLPRN